MRLHISLQIDSDDDDKKIGNVYEREIVEFLFGDGGPGLQALDKIRAELRRDKNSLVHFTVCDNCSRVWLRETGVLGDRDNPIRELLLLATPRQGRQRYLSEM